MSELDFNKNLEQCTTTLKSFAFNLTKNDEEAEDLLQDTAYKAIVNRDKFRAGTNFKAWLFTIMKNTFIFKLGILDGITGYRISLMNAKVVRGKIKYYKHLTKK